MLGLPRRYVRQLFYVSVALVLIFVLLTSANKSNYIHIQDYLGHDWTPSFFQPPGDVVIVDIAIQGCSKILSNDYDCGLPDQAEGLYGSLEDAGGWIKIDKDLYLGSSWYRKKYFSYKKIKLEELRKAKGNEDSKLAVIDIALADSSDKFMVGSNKVRVPEKIIKGIHSAKVYDNKEHEDKLKEHKDPSNKVSSIEKIPEYDTADDKNEKDDKDDKQKRASLEQDRGDLKIEYKIPNAEELRDLGWKYKSNGIWLRYGSMWSNQVLTGIDILFGEDAVDPRPNWELIKSKKIGNIKVDEDKGAYITIRRGPKVPYDTPEYQPQLRFNQDGKFKILQVADLHFSTGVGECRDPYPPESAENCKADPRTISFLDTILELEKPDLVVLTGDQIFGDTAPDAETAIFKALEPFVLRQIPFAVTMGNHDDDGSMNRHEVMSLSASLPFSLSEVGNGDIDGAGNYILKVLHHNSDKIRAPLLFLDSHGDSPNPQMYPGYGWIKESQIKWVEKEANELKKYIDNDRPISMAFFHIPLPEYKNLNQPIVGDRKEGVASPKYNSDARASLGEVGVQVVSVGHDHLNDYCLLDKQTANDQENLIWLCYGGGVGEGGYGGQDYVRRIRVYELDETTGEIQTWKRTAQKPEEVLHQQALINGAPTNQ